VTVPEYLSKHFTWHEVTYSETAEREGISNEPTEADCEIIEGTTAPFMEKVREALGNNSIYITSWYRGQALNSAVGGSSTSEHCYGRATDFTCPGFGSVYDVCHKLSGSDLPFNQLIYENHGASKWIHLSCAAPGTTPKRQVLTINPQGTFNGLIA
jgi:hypothetical protein